jgi:hypothetical protein
MVEPRLPPSNAQKAEVGYTFTAQGEISAHDKDVDIDASSKHHTLGRGPTQAAPGDHEHLAGDIVGLTLDHGGLEGLGDDDHPQYLNNTRGDARYASGTHGHDHGGLTGLGDDDHTQYLNNARGDARYPLKAGTGATGTWPIAITGDAGSVDGQSFAWSNPGTWPTYFWVVTTSGSGFLLHSAKIPQVFVGATTPTGMKAGDLWCY